MSTGIVVLIMVITFMAGACLGVMLMACLQINRVKEYEKLIAKYKEKMKAYEV